MDRYHRTPARTAGVAFLGTFALVVLIALTLGACQSTSRTDSAITRSEFAGKGLGFTLPTSAHEIFYLFHTGGRNDTVFYLRFDIDPKNLDSAVHDLLAANDRNYDRKAGFVRLPLRDAHLIHPRESLQPVTWWQPASVQRGYYVGGATSDNVRIVVDQDRSRVFFFQNQ